MDNTIAIYKLILFEKNAIPLPFYNKIKQNLFCQEKK